MLKRSHHPAHLLILALVLPGMIVWAGPASAQSEATVVYLVRHAERAEDGTNDPPLSPTGTARAQLLATMLADAGITQVHSTDYKRTRTSAAPSAAALGLTLSLYDPRDLSRFAAELRAARGRHLVLGHSNTTPALVEALGGDPGAPIDEAEYDRLYVVTVSDGGVTTVLLRFGESYGG